MQTVFQVLTDRRCSFFAQQCKNRRDELNDFTIQLVQVTRWQHRLIDQLDLLGVTTAERFGFVELITELRVSQFLVDCPCKQTAAIVVNRRSIIFSIPDDYIKIVFVAVFVADKGIERQHLIEPLLAIQFCRILKPCLR